MATTLSRTTTRSNLPIMVRATEPTKLTVTGQGVGETEGFGLPLFKETGKEQYYASISLAQPGEYTVIAKSEMATQSFKIIVKPQTFLNFPTEFGIFLVLLAVVLTGAFLWSRKKTEESASQG